MGCTSRWVALCVAPLSALVAQRANVRVVADVSGAPVPGLLVSLLTSSGTVAAAGITKADGTYLLVASQPGEYRVRAQRIGYVPVLTDAVTLREGQTVPL